MSYDEILRQDRYMALVEDNKETFLDAQPSHAVCSKVEDAIHFHLFQVLELLTEKLPGSTDYEKIGECSNMIINAQRALNEAFGRPLNESD